MDRLDPATCVLLVVDVQTRLLAAVPKERAERMVANAIVLIEAARVLGVRVVVSEQYPKGLGATVEPLAERLRTLGIEPVDKMTFDACGEPRIARALAEPAPRSVVVAGMEAHVCVYQTVRALARKPTVEVHVAADAVASRQEDNRSLGLALCERAGGVVTSTEAVVFDWLGRAGTPEFKAVSKLVR